MDEMTKLRVKEYGGIANDFLDSIDEALVRKGWNLESIAASYVKGAIAGILFKELPTGDQKCLFRIFHKDLSKKLAAMKKSKPNDNYSERLWQNGFTSQSTQKHLF